ncbi:MAG: hypothetical protein LBF27_32770 [Sphingobacterium sp.]|jgi:hypothetical protein|nr:hypothetical protein [Sphingobacterium sp.]
MKKLLIFSFIGILFLTGLTASAQFSKPLSVGAGAGSTINLTDLGNIESKFAFYGELDYLFTPFISVGLHGEKGTLAGNGYDSDFKNRYFAGNINGKIRVGQFLGEAKNYSYYTLQANMLSRILSNVYLGAGVGLVKNRITRNISQYYANYLESVGGEISNDVGKIHFVVPLNVGVDIPFGRTLYGPQWAINVNYQHTLTFNDNLDGIINSNNDQYGLISVGVKYALFNLK